MLDFYTTDRKAISLLKVLKAATALFKTQYGVSPKVWEMDNELAVSSIIQAWRESCGMRFEPSAPDTQDQNGGAERSGGVVKVKARAIRKGARFPKQLWPHIIGAAVYLLNRTPRQSFRWVSPLEELHGRLGSKELRPKWKKPN